MSIYIAAISSNEKAVRGSLFSIVISQNPFLHFQILIIWSQIGLLLLFNPNLSSMYACVIIPLCSECPSFRTHSFFLYTYNFQELVQDTPLCKLPYLLIQFYVNSSSI